MKQHLKRWLLLAGIFCFVLSATLISCDRDAIEAEPILIETETTPPIVLPDSIDLRCCEDGLKNTDSKNDKTEDED